MPLSDDERRILRQGRALGEMLGTEGWKEYEKILQAHCEERLALLLLPLGDSKHTEAMMAAVGQEYIKGAVYGLRLALSLPASTVEQSRELQDRES